jgi:hypothetical protein
MNPTETAVKVPAGGVDWPELLLPQQASEPSLRTPQLCELPAAIFVNVPAGAEV